MTQEPLNESASVPRLISGKWIIVGMFAFAIALTGTMWVYWKLHVGPFVAMQQALDAEFPGSKPRVEGGQRKKHKDSPTILRITMKVDFDPQLPENEPRAEARVDRVYEFVRDREDATGYELLEVHLYYPEPEDRLKQWSKTRKMN